MIGEIIVAMLPHATTLLKFIELATDLEDNSLTPAQVRQRIRDIEAWSRKSSGTDWERLRSALQKKKQP